MPKPKPRIEDLVAEKYDHPEVREAILKEIAKHETADKIISGECTLPSVRDAYRHVSGLAEAEHQKTRMDAGATHTYNANDHLAAQVKHKALTECE